MRLGKVGPERVGFYTAFRDRVSGFRKRVRHSPIMKCHRILPKGCSRCAGLRTGKSSLAFEAERAPGVRKTPKSGGTT